MGAKGQPKTAGSGRKPGSGNKNRLPLAEKARQLKVDPFEILLLFAKNDWKSLGYESKTVTIFSRKHDPYEVDVITPDMRLRAASEAIQYLHPKLRAVETKSDHDDHQDKEKSKEEVKMYVQWIEDLSKVK